MFDKLKTLIKMHDEIEKITKDMEHQAKAFNEMKSENEGLRKDIHELKSEVKKLRESTDEFLDEFSENIKSLKNLKGDIEGELSDLKLFKSRLNHTIKDELLTEFRNNVNETCDRLKTDVKQYNDLKHKLEEMAKTMELANQNMHNFNKIASEIKEKDFSLERYAKQLQKQDSEKLELMRKIDALERLISVERRRKHNQ